MDAIVSKYIGRKFLVFCIATFTWLFTHKMSTEYWVIVSTLYIGTEGAVSIAKLFTGKMPKLNSQTTEVSSKTNGELPKETEAIGGGK